MKKITAVLTAVLMCIGFSSCGDSSVDTLEEEVTTESTTDKSNVEDTTETTTETPTECNHKWTEATCESPKTCEICNKTEGKAIDHSTHKGKCATCGEYILDEAFIPDFKNFTDCVGLSEVPSDFTLSFSKQTDKGFDCYFSIPDNQRIESCENLGWDICIGYTGTADFNIINMYIMNYVPTNQNELDELYSAILNEYEKKLGSSTAGKWLASTGNTELIVDKAHNGISVFIKFAD